MKPLKKTSVNADDLFSQPRFGKGPVPHHGPGRDLQQLSRLFYAQAPEKSQFDDLALTLIKLCQVFQRVIERYDFVNAFMGNHHSFVK